METSTNMLERIAKVKFEHFKDTNWIAQAKC